MDFKIKNASFFNIILSKSLDEGSFSKMESMDLAVLVDLASFFTILCIFSICSVRPSSSSENKDAIIVPKPDPEVTKIIIYEFTN